jgi:hypothetical protein
VGEGEGPDRGQDGRRGGARPGAGRAGDGQSSMEPAATLPVSGQWDRFDLDGSRWGGDGANRAGPERWENQ